ncbi:MAG: GntR family transcriptional regulator [Desulfobacula sp.]|jgi:DNA-binding GntR family transcriptional regulator
MDNINIIEKKAKTVLQIADNIKSAIVTGELKPGQRLIEVQLCKLFDVKRNKIREALRILDVEGFVQITPNVGAAVRGFSRQDIESTYDIQSVLDGLAVRLATLFLTTEQLSSLENLLYKMESTDKLELYAKYNEDFHGLFAAYSGNDRLTALCKNMRINIKAFGDRSFFVPGQMAASNSEHREIFRAVSAKKPQEAEQIMRSHVIDAKNRLLIYLQKI